MNVKVKNVTGQSPHWLVLEGSIEGVPAVTHRRSIHAAALADGQTTVGAEVAALTETVETAYQHWLAVQKAIALL